MTLRKAFEFKQLSSSQEEGVDSTACPTCGCKMSRVTETRRVRGLVIRVRLCRNCRKTFRTKEIPDEDIKWPSADSRRAQHLDVGAVFPSAD